MGNSNATEGNVDDVQQALIDAGVGFLHNLEVP